MKLSPNLFCKTINYENLKFLLKLILSIILTVFFVYKIDFSDVINNVQPANFIIAILASSLILSCQVFVAAYRLKLAARIYGLNLSIWVSWIVCQYGGFFSHTPASFIGGDAIRIMKLKKNGYEVSDITKSIFFDRFSGFFILIILTIVGALLLAQEKADEYNGILFILITIGFFACVAIIIISMFIPNSLLLHRSKYIRTLTNMLSFAKNLSYNIKSTFITFLFSYLMYLLGFIAIYVVSIFYNIDLDFYIIVMVCPLVWLVSMLPLSVGGWGVRESSFVFVLSVFGIDNGSALVLSITYGVAVFLSYLPGAYFYLKTNIRK